ncbi:MAG: UDP-glucose 4-epimerase GalE [Candidatus Dojkabacteria bacterium]
MKKILVTGGAGYIGSHAVFALAERGYQVVILDNLFRGYKQAVETLQNHFSDEQILFEKVDLLEFDNLKQVLAKHDDAEVLMHFAALCLVNESMEQPDLYFRNNTQGTINLLEAMRAAGIKNLVFSSTCNIYKVVGDGKVDEQVAAEPPNPYGESKYLSERMITWYEQIYGLNAVRFRYFNVCGANSEGIIGDSKKPSQLLIQNAVRGALGIEPFSFTYGEVDTPDGSPVRDYINVEDLADIHVLAAEKLMAGEEVAGLYNVGTGTGNSVKEAVDLVKEVTGKDFPTEKGQARKGEPSKIYADTTKTKKTFGWEAKRSIEDSIVSLVKWYEKHPNGWDE